MAGNVREVRSQLFGIFSGLIKYLFLERILILKKVKEKVKI